MMSAQKNSRSSVEKRLIGEWFRDHNHMWAENKQNGQGQN